MFGTAVEKNNYVATCPHCRTIVRIKNHRIAIADTKDESLLAGQHSSNVEQRTTKIPIERKSQGDSSFTPKDLSHSSSGLGAVIEKLERYCNYLQNQLNKKQSGRFNGIQLDHTADDADRLSSRN